MRSSHGIRDVFSRVVNVTKVVIIVNNVAVQDSETMSTVHITLKTLLYADLFILVSQAADTTACYFHNIAGQN
jgi:hypothetical protein